MEVLMAAYVWCENRNCKRGVSGGRSLVLTDYSADWCSAECHSVDLPVAPPMSRAQTMNVREAEAALSSVRSPEQTARLHAAQEQDLMIRAAGLQPSG
jgi:hypothetical protein